jgi:hypothetical protein
MTWVYVGGVPTDPHGWPEVIVSPADVLGPAGADVVGAAAVDVPGPAAVDVDMDVDVDVASVDGVALGAVGGA